MNGLAARIHDALPQTQCTRCGYPDCAGYAQAVAEGEAAINQCPPGGAEGVARLAQLTGRPLRPLDAQFGTEGPRAMAVIDEAWCIGCTLCLDACPTDAIVGMNKRMHTVIEAHCTGCELCIPVCPVDCIALEDATPGRTGWAAWSKTQADAALGRYALHQARLQKPKAEPAPAPDPAAAPVDRKRAIVEAALARARAASQQRTQATKP
ncbi:MULTISPECIES: RnfABCDGE type electron transport complex subunit B [unclassified Variovorax]|uniref:RnfABCDGE type electron transport complex subunit B n=1 Tax=unclassified Variovorax TaxID=663243 RepID=UPI0025764746|nr:MULTISPECIES: RnfABCDGE type electron transport complex subunit B [unclassified Variovorax]MDM0086877.1 RnfABCDGE type electron transport complex subunit B [Variovorax sp. J22G40]MDM0144867.1 RnfABCDGE type electron transport complex subunit B [Variovorax sp. J2P1-31]